MKKLLFLLALIPTFLFGQTPPIYNVLGAGNNANSRSLIGLSLVGLRGATSGTVTVQAPAVVTTYTFVVPANDGTSGQYLQTDGNGVTSWQTISTDLTVGTTVINSGTTGRILYDNAGVLGEYSAIPIAFGGTNNTSAYTAGSVIFSNGTSLTQDNSNFFWDDGNNRLGIGIATPTATIHGKGAGSDSSTSLFYGVAANGRNILGVQNGGSVGINCLAGQAGVVNGAISDCALEVCSRTNEANNSFIFAAKSYSATQTYFRIRSNSQPGYIGEFYQGWKHFGNMGFNINPDSTRQVYIKGWNASASWYPFIVTNSAGTNLFNMENDGHINTFGFFTTNRLATNASIATVTGGLAVNTVKTTIAASGDGSSALRICGVDALAAGNGGFISFEAVYDASNKYAMGTIGGIKENATSGNSAGALVFQTHTSGVGSMTERMRIRSNGVINFNAIPAYSDNAAALAGGLVAGDLYYTDTAGEYIVKITH